MKYSNYLLKTLIAFVLLFISATNSQAQSTFSFNTDLSLKYGVIFHYNQFYNNYDYYSAPQTGGSNRSIELSETFWYKKNGISLSAEYSKYQINKRYVWTELNIYQFEAKNTYQTINLGIGYKHKFEFDSVTGINLGLNYKLILPISKSYTEQYQIDYLDTQNDSLITYHYNYQLDYLSKSLNGFEAELGFYKKKNKLSYSISSYIQLNNRIYTHFEIQRTTKPLPSSARHTDLYFSNMGFKFSIGF